MNKYCLLLVLLLLPNLFFGQQDSRELEKGRTDKRSKLIEIRGTVKEDNTLKPVRNVEIRVVGGQTYKTDRLGDFRIRARIGDEIIISHDDFNTIYHTITGSDRIDVKVQEDTEGFISKKDRKQKKLSAAYGENLKAARNTMKKDAAISIDYVTKALETVEEDDTFADEKKAELFETLGDIYAYHDQPDLAESNYKTSIINKYSTDVKIKLGNAQLQNKDYQSSFLTFNQLKKSKLNAVQRIQVYEGLGDSYKGQNDFENASKNYNIALSFAQKNKSEDIVIELNSKLAEIFQIQGNLNDAEQYLDNSVQLASRRSKKSSARQRAKAADFYNKNNSFDKEIQLRKEALEDIQEIEENEAMSPRPIVSDSVGVLNSIEDRAITSQVQNYKIANAFAAQSEYDAAIPYLEESIKKAASENDLVVQKDATRKLGEVYREKGELKKASEAFEEYEVIIDKLYIQKEQEISQAKRLSRELALRANRITSLEQDRKLNESRYKLAFASQELAGQQKIIIYSLIGLSVLLLLVAYLMFRNIKQQRFANNLLALKSLRSQMNPHFIFNALNSVNTFIATSDERAANRYLTDFSLLMRAVLENSEEDFIPLEKEIELLELYVQLEHFRFQDKFEYKIEVDPEIDVKQYMIPPMLLQPYVENAVWHGLRYKSEKGLLSIKFLKTTDGTIEIAISDNGIGREKSKALKTLNQKKQKSQGMSNIKKRIQILNTMYKDKVDVFISDLTNDDEATGTQVKLLLKKDT
ncbi:tetratricopeptide repeat-containing sensor histidine kinase [Aquimarina litoralis]|uniref:tetratricopeptide repeat-containing sensor histidine kinase n=1 Tax=Aquimarina litoralis TaxID=584605 RepID=UPI001C567554|nr:histidine kinase [Aquimarina litoralis]MBW1294632.1 sensor histidine kinase [Aquimarina litoralis]